MMGRLGVEDCIVDNAAHVALECSASRVTRFRREFVVVATAAGQPTKQTGGQTFRDRGGGIHDFLCIPLQGVLQCSASKNFFGKKFLFPLCPKQGALNYQKKTMSKKAKSTSTPSPAVPAAAVPEKTKSKKTAKKTAVEKVEKTIVKKTDGPKRPPNAYFLFQNKVRDAVKAENPTLSVTERARIIGLRYKELSDDERAEFKRKADVLSAAHKALLAK